MSQDDAIGPDDFGGEDYPSDGPVPLAIEVAEEEDDDENGDPHPMAGTLLEVLTKDELSVQGRRIEALERTIEMLQKHVSPALVEVIGSIVAEELDEQFAHAKEMTERLDAQVDVALVDVSSRLDRIEEHIGFKPSLLSAVQRAVGELDDAAQVGRMSPRNLARVHRILREAAQVEQQKRLAGD